MPEVTITRTDSDSKARYVATVAGVEGEAELTLSKVSATLIIADHTGVPEAMRGLGVARALAARLIADARAAGQRIVPLCPFVRAGAAAQGGVGRRHSMVGSGRAGHLPPTEGTRA